VELTNEFSIPVPVDEAWAVLTDLERVAPCMPGFELQEVEGGEYRGLVRVKVGPITARYEGVASFQERDPANRRAVVRADGRETRGQGNASATVTATLAPEDGGTRVTLHTDLKVSGRVAQFGRSVLADVSSRLLGQFVQALEADVLAGAASAGTRATGSAAVAEPAAPAAAGPRRIESASGDPVDLLRTAGPWLIKRVGPLVIALAVVLWLLLRR
jgi:carbon monoxide dehydrogenase subunit G